MPSRVPSCLLKVGCGGSPVLQLPILFGKLGISRISWPNMRARGESNQRSDFTTGAKLHEHVRKPVCLLSQRVRGRQEAPGACCGSIANSGCVTGRGWETKGSLRWWLCKMVHNNPGQCWPVWWELLEEALPHSAVPPGPRGTDKRSVAQSWTLISSFSKRLLTEAALTATLHRANA